MTKVGSLSFSERLKLNKLFRSGPEVLGTLNNLVKMMGLPRVKVSQFLNSKLSYAEFQNRRLNFPRLQVEARLINDIWCMGSAQVDNFSSCVYSTKFLMVYMHEFSRFIRVQPMRK